MDNQNPTTNPTPPTENVPAQAPVPTQTPAPVQTPAAAQNPPPQAYTAPQPATPPPSPKSFFSKKILLLAVILLILLGAGAAYLALNSKPKPQPIVSKPTPTSAPTPTPDPTANWKIYNNAILGLYFKYPSDWRIIEDSSSTSATLYPSTSDPNLSKEKVNFSYRQISFSPQPSPETGMTPFTPITIAGITGRQTQDDPKGPGRTGECSYTYRIELPIKNGTLDFNSCTSLVPQFSKILSTFKFLETSSSPTCKPRPACLDTTPKCLIPETPDMCPKAVACTQDAKLCPDGKTYVGRQGPKCEFAACPGQ